MGIPISEVDAMSWSQWVAVSKGWERAHSREDDEPAPPTAQEYRELMRAHRGN